MTRALALALTAAGLLLAFSGTAHAGYCHSGDISDDYPDPFRIGAPVEYYNTGTYTYYNGTIDWGDGTTESIGSPGSWTHKYRTPGTFILHVSGDGSYDVGNGETPCNDNDSAEITVWPFARLGLLGGFQHRPETTKLNIYLHPGAVQHPVDVAWKTQDATAKKGEDYVPASGVMHLTPGTVSSEFSIVIKEPEFSQPPEVFNIVLTGASGAFIDKEFQRSAIYLFGTPGPYFFRAKPTGIDCGVANLNTRQPKLRCDHKKDRAAFLNKGDKARVKDVKDSLKPNDPEILKKGEKTEAGPFTCKALADAVHCETKKHGFTVGKKKEDVF